MGRTRDLRERFWLNVGILSGMLELVLPDSGAVAADDHAWASKARCRGTDPDALFVRGAKQREAAVICRRCPVITECGAKALDNREEFGVWGGMTERQRKALLKQHPEVLSWTEFLDTRNARSVG